MTNSRLACTFYEQNDQGVRLLPFQCQGEQNWSCPQHRPLLIHQPAQLAGKLPGIEKINPAEGHA